MAHYNRASSDLTRPFDGAGEAVEGAFGTGLSAGNLNEQTRALTHQILEAFGLSPYFHVVIGGDSLPVRQPDPAPLRQAVADLCAFPALYVGDSEVDAEAAVVAGVPMLLFTEGYPRKPLYEVPHAAAFSSLGTLVGLVEDLSPM